MKKPRSPRGAKDRGAALVLVLWGAVVMSIIAAAAARQSNTAAAVVSAGAELTRARALSDAGVRAGWTAFSNGQINDFNAVWGCRSGEDTLLVRVRPEASRIDINMASEAMLAALYRNAGAEQQRAQDLAAETIAYREFSYSDDQSGTQVVEGTDKIPEGTFRRGPFQTVEELGYVPGMDATLFRAIADDITVYSRVTDIDLRNASPLVQRTFQQAASQSSGAAETAATTAPSADAFEGTLVAVRSIAVMQSGAAFVRQGVVEGPFDRESAPKIVRMAQGALGAGEALPDASRAPSCGDGFAVVRRLAQ